MPTLFCLKGKAISPPPEARGGGESHVVEEPSTPGNHHMHENRETSVLAAAGQSGPGRGKTSKLGVYDAEESESAVVPMNTAKSVWHCRPLAFKHGKTDFRG